MTQLPETELIELDRQGSVLRLWFNNPERRNALSGNMAQEIFDTLEAIRDDRTIRTLVIRGRGGVFCAGGDIKGFKSNSQAEANPAEVTKGNRFFGELMDQLNELPQVVVMLVEGGAIGGGLGLSCVGDVTIISKDAKFAMTETSLGIPPAQIAPFVVQRIGLTQARRMMLTGVRMDGAVAVDVGIGHFLAEDGDDLEVKLAEILKGISRCAPGANAVTKSILFATERLSRSDALDFAAEGFADCMLSDEGREGVAAFVEKRKASWMEEG